MSGFIAWFFACLGVTTEKLLVTVNKKFNSNFYNILTFISSFVVCLNFFRMIEISDGSGGFLSSEWASGSKFPDDRGTMCKSIYVKILESFLS